MPGGIDQYVAERRPPAEPAAAPKRAPKTDSRAARKEVARLERALEKLDTRENALHEAMAAAATDHTRLGELQAELAGLEAEREDLEAAWLEASEALE